MLEGIVTCVKHAATLSENLYMVTSVKEGAAKVLELRSSIVLHLGDFVRANLVDGKLESAIIEDSKDRIDSYRTAAAKYAGELAVNSSPSAVEELDKVTNTMRPKLKAAASLLIERLLMGSPLIVRFHNDADGATGGYGLYLAFQELFRQISPSGSPKVFWKMQRGVAYTVGDAREDEITIGNYNSIAKPVLLITDFGTTEESMEGARISSERFDIIWLDHHPVLGSLAELIENYINPWQFGGDSNYTAGFLSCEFGKLFANIDVREVQAAALVGDYSAYADEEGTGKDLALLLDMLTSDKKIAISSGATDLTPLEIDQILGNPKRRVELVNYARTRIEDAIDSGIEALKKYKTEYASVYLLDFENVRRDFSTKYPLPGRYASKLLERIEQDSEKPPILVLHFGHFISIRVSTPIAERVNLLEKINELKAGYSYIDSAGGHKNAASIKLRTDEAKKELIVALLRALGCNIS